MSPDEMEAGAEMDKLVAERVLGWEPRCRYYPRFSTDLAAAWLVVEKMTTWTGEGDNRSRYEFTLYMNARDKWFCAFNDFADETDGDHDTAPLAICRASLKACVAALAGREK